MVMGSETGGFESPAAKHTAVGPTPVQIEKGDFNRDGKLDLAILSIGWSSTQPYGRSLYVLRGDGAGGFVTPFVTVFSTEDSRSRFAVGDFNGDEWLDLALLAPGSNTVRVALNAKNAETPTFAEKTPGVSVAADSLRIASGDFNGDGADDWVVAGKDDQDGGLITVIPSDGEGGPAPGGGTIQTEFTPTAISVSDVDGDGFVDAAAAGNVGSVPSAFKAGLFLGNGTGSLAAVQSVELPGTPSELALGDLDGNGLEDFVLVITNEDLLVSILLEDGSVPTGVFVRGDGNGDEKIDISDAVSALGYLFMQKPTDCLEALDSNDDGQVNIGDPIFLLSYLFSGGAMPPSPFPEPGQDPQPDGLGCRRK